jgi:hypothetical protein
MRGWKAVSFKQFSEFCKYRKNISKNSNICDNNGTYSGCECCASFCSNWRNLGRADLAVKKISSTNTPKATISLCVGCVKVGCQMRSEIPSCPVTVCVMRQAKQ